MPKRYLPDDVLTASRNRIAWVFEHGSIPDGLLVCHRCDNPPCCNPSHLFVGTYADNVRDMIVKGRNSRLLLSDELVAEIRKSPLSSKKLGPLLGVSHNIILRIRNKKGQWQWR